MRVNSLSTNYLSGCYRKLGFRWLMWSLCICTCICLDTLEAVPLIMNEQSSITVSYFVVNSLLFGGQFLPYFGFVFASGLIASENCRERLGGISRYLVGRMGIKRYTAVRAIYTYTGAASISTAGMLMFCSAAMCFQPFYSRTLDPEMCGFPYFAALSHGNGLWYLVIVLYLLALSGIFYAAIAMVCDAAFGNVYVTSASPLLASYLITRVLVLFHLPHELRFDLWLRARCVYHSEGMTLFLCTLIVIVAAVVCWRIYYRQMCKQFEGE